MASRQNSCGKLLSCAILDVSINKSIILAYAEDKFLTLYLGWDLLDKQVQEHVKAYLRSDKPGLVLLAPPCTLFSTLQQLSIRLRHPSAAHFDEHLKELRRARLLYSSSVWKFVNYVTSWDYIMFLNILGEQVHGVNHASNGYYNELTTTLHE